MDGSETQRISDHLVRLVQVVFALVLAQSLFLFRGVVVDPFNPEHHIAALALLAIFTTTVLSWVDWHISMVFSPYQTRKRSEKIRLFADLLVVVIYAYLLFTVEALIGRPAGSLSRYLFGFPLVFTAYVLSGVTRRLNYGAAASRLQPIVLFGIAYLLLWIVYSTSRKQFQGIIEHLRILNLLTLLLVTTMMISYRHYRATYKEKLLARKGSGFTVA